MLSQNYFQFDKVSYDVEADAIYIKFLDGKYASSDELSKDMIIDKDKKGNILGLEILKASKQKGIIDRILFSSADQKKGSGSLQNILLKEPKKEIMISKR